MLSRRLRHWVPLFTGGEGKRSYCKNVAGISIDIWIDDCPESILFDYRNASVKPLR